uniref:4-coumarate--CoA ligase n=1 Tax=Anthurium amnicola TaxID=1678845 RepID=A0A1D1YSF3_9ARAE
MRGAAGPGMSAFTSPNRFSRLIHLDSCRRPLPTSFRCPPLYSPNPPASSSALGLRRILRFTRPPSPRVFSASAAELPANTSMEVVKAALKHCSAQPGSVALRVRQKSYSYAQLISSARIICNLLCTGDLNNSCTGSMNGVSSIPVGVIGEGKSLDGARIGIVAKPSAEFVAGVFATWLGGGVAVPLAVSYPEAELLHVMNDSDVSVILSTEEHQELMKNVAAKCGAQFSLIPDVLSITSDINSHDKVEMGEVDFEEWRKEIEDSKAIGGDDNALIVYTSGTTGKPKGVVHTHKGITAQVKILTEAWEYSSSDQFLHCLPLHHVHGLFNALLAPLYAGSVVEFMPKFSVRGIWERWRESFPKDGTKVDTAITVFTGMCGSSALPYPLMKQWESITGHRLLERYGMTEFVMALSNPLLGTRKGGTVGKPLPHVQVRILAENDNGTDSLGVGELCVRSPSLFKEYWKQPEVTKESFVDGGFFKTGDTVKVDEDGYYIILGRSSADIMKVGGYKLSALEIESVILEHPVVSECSVLGIPDKDYGEAVCAIIVPEAGAKRETESRPALSLEELRIWSKDKLAPYKIPTRLLLWDSLPRNAMGKVNKKELKKLLE